MGGIEREGDATVVRFAPAHVHRSVGRPGWDDGVGGWQDCAFIIEDGSIEGDVGGLPTDVMHGDLRLGGVDHPNLIALPWDVVGEAVSLVLHLEPDYRKIVVSGICLRVCEEGEFKQVEEFHASL